MVRKKQHNDGLVDGNIHSKKRPSTTKFQYPIYECVCGNRMDRDENAAINICREGIRISGMMLDIEKKIF